MPKGNCDGMSTYRALVGTFSQEKALVGAFSEIVKFSRNSGNIYFKL